MRLGRWTALAVMLLSSGAGAQPVSPANMGITPTVNPETLQVLDAGTPNTWVAIGTVDPVAHSFTPSGTSTGTLAGGWLTAVISAPIAASTTSASRSVTGSSSITQALVANTGTVGAYCGIGATATVNYQYIAPGGWFAFQIAVGANSVACITASSSTTINVQTGSGLATGTGGGGGGGTLTWPGTAAVTNYGVAPTGTVPGVNAFITNSSGVLTWPGTAAPTNYATAPTGTVPGVNAAVTNVNSNGPALMSGSSPVNIASDQTAIAIKAAAAAFVAGWSPDIGNCATASAWTGSGTPSLCSLGMGNYIQLQNLSGLPTVSSGALVKGTTTAMTGTSSTQVIAAVTSQVIYVTNIHCNNSHATVSSLVSIQDGSGGAVLDTLSAGANYGGDNRTGSTPLFWTTSGNGLFAADVTTGASVVCQASGYSHS